MYTQNNMHILVSTQCEYVFILYSCAPNLITILCVDLQYSGTCTYVHCAHIRYYMDRILLKYAKLGLGTHTKHRNALSSQY